MIKKLKSVAAAILRRIHVAGWFGVAFLFVAGILAWVGFNHALETTNT